MLKFLLHRPIAVLTTAMGLLISGLAATTTLPVSLLPETAIPQITVQLSYPNSTAVALEQTIVKPLRNQLLQVSRLKDIRSSARNGSATIVLDFEYGINTNLAFIEVNEKVDQALGLLPRDLERPRVLKASVTDIPVFYLSIIPGEHPPLELAAFARSILKRRIEQLPQVAFVDVSGYARPEAVVRPIGAKMQSLNLSESRLEAILRENNLRLGSVLVQDGQYQYNIRFLSEITSPEELAGIYFRHEGQVLQLKDIAEVELQARRRQGAYLYDGQEAIVMAVRKQADAQLFALKKEFNKLLRAFREDYPGLSFQLSNDQSELLEVSVDNLRTSLAYGAFFAVLVMFVFFRGWQAPLLIALAIPVSLVIALLGFYLLGLSINIISLSGLILGVGLMIDNSIIVIENIRQYRKMGYERTAACAGGANEVIRPLISSALTTCSVFVPLLFLSGLAGALFYDQALSVTLALGASLLTAYFLLPLLLRLLGPGQAEEAREAPEYLTAANWYTRSVDAVLRHRGWFLLAFPVLLGAAWMPLQSLQQESFPPLSRNALSVDIDWNEPISLEENEQRVRELAGWLQPGIRSSNAFVGEQQFLLEQERQGANQARLLVFRNAAEQQQLPARINRRMSGNYPRAVWRTEPLKNVFDEIFGSEQPPLLVQLQAADSGETPPPAAVLPVLEYLRQQGLNADLPPVQEQYELAILREKCLLYDVPYENAYQKLLALFNDYHIGALRATNEFIPIVIGGEQAGLKERIHSARVHNDKGQLVPLEPFIQLRLRQDYKTITAGRSGEYLSLPLPVYSDSLQQGLARFLREHTRLTAHFSGQAFENRQTIREVSVVLAISLLLLYLILAAQFESLVQPFIVMMAVPLGIAGALYTLWWFGQSINLVSVIGMIVMSGIVVNDAILKVDMMNRLSREHSLQEAIHGAGIRRLKPIVMTSATTILALLPILFAGGLGAELQRPLAYAVIGGLLAGTLSSLYFIPLFYAMLYPTLINPSKLRKKPVKIT